MTTEHQPDAAPPVAAALDPVAQLRRIADEDIGANAPWLAGKLHAFAGQLAAEMRGECQLEAVQRAEAAERKLAEVETYCRTHPERAGAGFPQMAADILAIIGTEGREETPYDRDFAGPVL